jgi:hypothetical protein
MFDAYAQVREKLGGAGASDKAAAEIYRKLTEYKTQK